METYDASIGGEKGLLYVGCGGAQAAAPSGEAEEDEDGGGGPGVADGGKGEGGGGGGETSGGGSGKDDDDNADDVLDTGIQFVSARDSSVLLAFDVRRLLACDAKGRYRMVLTYLDDGDGGGGNSGDAADGEKRLAVVRVHGTAVDRVIGAVLDLAEETSSRAGTGSGGAADDGSDRANDRLPAFAADSAYAPAGVQGAPTGPEDLLSAAASTGRPATTPSTHGGSTPTASSDPSPKEV